MKHGGFESLGVHSPQLAAFSQRPIQSPSFPHVLGGGSTGLLCGCQVTEHTNAIFLMTLLLPRPKRDLLLCVARHTAVTLTRNAPLSKAQSPGLSVSANEPSGVFDFSWFCQSSSRSLGRCLLL